MEFDALVTGQVKLRSINLGAAGLLFSSKATDANVALVKYWQITAWTGVEHSPGPIGLSFAIAEAAVANGRMVWKNVFRRDVFHRARAARNEPGITFTQGRRSGCARVRCRATVRAMRVPVVEDDPEIAAFVTRGLQRGGYAVDDAR